MARLPLTLRTARARLLGRLRRSDPETALDIAATHLPLLAQGPWPGFLDHDAVVAHAETIDARLGAGESGRKARTWLRSRGLEALAQSILDAALPHMDWRLSADSPDALVFRGAVADILGAARPVRVAADRWDTLGISLVPDPQSTLNDLWDSPIDAHGRADTLGTILTDLEEGGMAHTLQTELLLHATGPIPPDARHPAFDALWRWAIWTCLDATHAFKGRWIAPIRNTPLKTLAITYGDGQTAAGMRAAMAAVSQMVADLDGIGGARTVMLWNDEGPATGFSLAPTGRILGDNPDHPWADLALRSALAHGLITGAALVVERQGPVTIGGKRVRETFAARLQDGEPSWFDAQACRAVFTQDFATGLMLPHDEGRVYRDGPGSTD